MKRLIVIALVALLVSCATGNQNLDAIGEIVQGMTIGEVVEIIGKPDRILPIQYRSLGTEDTIEEYVYGGCTIRMKNGRVQAVIR